MLFVCASFVGMVHSRLEAASELPELLVVSCVRGAVNSVTLSTNTVGTSLDILISDATGSDEQLIGVVEWNATKQTTDTWALNFAQLEGQPSTTPATNNWPLLSAGCGDQSTATDFATWQACKVESNVATSSTDTYSYQAGVAINNTAGTATLTTATASTYCGLIGVLTFYAVDDANNSIADGTYRGSFLISISA